jgi:hypothetical protein
MLSGAADFSLQPDTAGRPEQFGISGPAVSVTFDRGPAEEVDAVAERWVLLA